MQLRGFHLLRIGGIPVIIDYSWFIIFFLVIYTMAEINFPQAHPNYTTLQYYIVGIITATLLFGSVLIHELAHSFVAMKLGIRVTSIRLFIFGGLAQISSEPKNGRHEFLIALAGPAMSMLLGMFFGAIYVFYRLAENVTLVTEGAFNLFVWNVMMAVFNMIPGFPLDGGRILRAILWDRWDNLSRATKLVSQLGNGFALFLIVLGILQLLIAQSILSGLLFIFIGLFMKHLALGSYQAVVMKQVLAGVQIRQIMTENVVTVDWLLSIEELVRDYIYKHPFTNFPVFNRDDFIGMVSLDQVKTVPKELWVFKQVRDILIPIDKVPCLKPTDDATEALTRMVSSDIGRMPVVDNGQLIGIVSRRDIMNLFRVKSDLGVA